MTATEELCRMLDERGVEWVGTNFAEPTEGHPTNTSLGSEYHDAVFIEYTDGSVLRLFDLTPEQTIAATLGDSVATVERHGVAKTCHLKPWEMEHDTGFYDCMECDCGYVADVADWAEWHYCPRCGMRISEVNA